jgi:SAM-dependent methyltransferase
MVDTSAERWWTEAAAALLGYRCPVCGCRTRRGKPWRLAPELVEGWRIDARWRRRFERREGVGCRSCGTVSRFQYLARVIMDELGAGQLGYDTFAGYADSAHFKRLRVAEINGCGALHGFLARNPSLAYSEYGSEDPDIPSEDLLALSYGDGVFDLVVTSDTLEHVPDLARALGEIERVLKPGGRHIFTVPTVWDGRKTRQRAATDDGEIVHFLPPSYHGAWEAKSPDRLVFHEFGEDVLDYLRTAGTRIRIRRDPANPSLTVYVAVRASAGGPESV